MPFVPGLPLTQLLPGPAPRVQLMTPVPLLAARVSMVPLMFETLVCASAASGAGAGGIAFARPPPTFRQPAPRFRMSMPLPSVSEPENGAAGAGVSPGPPQSVVPCSVTKVTAPSGLAGGGQPGKSVEVVDVLVEVVVRAIEDVVVMSVDVVVVAPGRVVVVGVTGGTHGLTVSQSSPAPGTEAAPGPGRLPAASTVGSKVGGTPKTLTRVPGTAPPRMPTSGLPK